MMIPEIDNPIETLPYVAAFCGFVAAIPPAIAVHTHTKWSYKIIDYSPSDSHTHEKTRKERSSLVYSPFTTSVQEAQLVSTLMAAIRTGPTQFMITLSFFLSWVFAITTPGLGLSRGRYIVSWTRSFLEIQCPVVPCFTYCAKLSIVGHLCRLELPNFLTKCCNWQ